MRGKENAPLDGYFTMAQAEEMLGLRGNGLARWMRRHHMKLRRVGKYLCISVKQLERYEQITGRSGIERVNKRPRGWIGIHQAAELGGVCLAFIWKRAQRGQIQAVRVGYTQFYEPDSVRRCVLELRERTAPGWVPLVDACAGADVTAAADWLKRNGHEVRMYMRQESKQRILHAREESVTAWKAYHATYNGGRKLTFAQAQEIRRRRAAGEKPTALAGEFGVAPAAIRQIVIGRTYRQEAAD